MQQHHSLSRITDQDDYHFLGLTPCQAPLTLTPLFNKISFWDLLMLPSFMKCLLREGKDSKLTNGWARNSNSHVPTFKYCIGQKVHLGFLGHVMEKPEWTFWPTQYNDCSMAFSYFPAVETTGDSNNNHIKHNFTLLEGHFPESFFNPITNWDT